MNWTMIIPESTWFIIFCFQAGISIGLVAIWNYRCIQVNELREEKRRFEKNNMEKIKKKMNYEDIKLRQCKRCGEFFKSNYRASYCKKCNRNNKWRKEKEDKK